MINHIDQKVIENNIKQFDENNLDDLDLDSNDISKNLSWSKPNSTLFLFLIRSSISLTLSSTSLPIVISFKSNKSFS
jgi:hypothetical protein